MAPLLYGQEDVAVPRRVTLRQSFSCFVSGLFNSIFACKEFDSILLGARFCLLGPFLSSSDRIQAPPLAFACLVPSPALLTVFKLLRSLLRYTGHHSNRQDREKFWWYYRRCGAVS